jgi:hypothetical protein
MTTIRNHLSVPSSKAGYEDGNDRCFRYVGIQKSEAGDTPKRLLTIFKTRRKFEIKNSSSSLHFVTLFTSHMIEPRDLLQPFASHHVVRLLKQKNQEP